MLKRLVVCRHGSYGSDGKLNPHGRGQMMVLAKKLELAMKGMSIRILSSTATRAKQSADVLGVTLLGLPNKLPIEEHGTLFERDGHPTDFHGTLVLLRSLVPAVDVTILVTHVKHAREFPSYFAAHQLGRPSVRSSLIDLGEYWDLDCQTGALTRVSS